MSLRDQIAQFDDRKGQTVVIPEWGDVKLEVRSMSTRERGRITSAVTDDGDMDYAEFNVRTVIASTFDPDTGEKVFNEGDLPMLMDKHGGVVERLARMALHASGLGRQDSDRLGGSYSATQSGGST